MIASTPKDPSSAVNLSPSEESQFLTGLKKDGIRQSILEKIRMGTDGLEEATVLHRQYPYTRDVICDFRLVGFPAAWNPFVAQVSPPRLSMYGKHQSQAVPIKGGQQPYTYSGLETDHASYATNTSKRTEDVEVLDAIPKYRKYPNAMGPKETPSWLVIFRGMTTRKINCIMIDRYVSCAEGWGYKNHWNEEEFLRYLRPGEIIPKEVELSRPPTVEGPRHKVGVNATVVYLPDQAVDQDAVVISDDLADDLMSSGVVKRSGIHPPDYVPIPIYATDEFPDKWHPDIGETIRDDGTVAVFRKLNTDRFVADASASSLSRYDPNLDIVIKGPPGGKVVDIDYWVNRQHMEDVPLQVRPYMSDNQAFWRRIVDIYRKYPTAMIDDHFGVVVTEAICRLAGMGEKNYGIAPKENTPLEGIRQMPVEYLHVMFTFYHDIPATLASKLCGRSGDKGLVSKVLPTRYMPRDEDGFVAHIWMDPPSPVKRLAVSQFYEQAFNRISEFVRRQCLDKLNREGVESAWSTLVEWYMDVHPAYGELAVETFNTLKKQEEHVRDVTNDFIYLNIPGFLKTIREENIDIWREKWNVRISRVTYWSENSDGVMVEKQSDDEIAIGSKYILRMNKNGEFSSPGVSTVSHHGTPIAPPKSTALRSLFKTKPSRLGEDETRSQMNDIDPKEVLRHARLSSRSPRIIERVVIPELFNNPHPTQIRRFEVSDEDLARHDVIAHQLHHTFGVAGVETYDTLRSVEDPDKLTPDDWIGQ